MTQPAEVKICPICEHKNAATATECASCGAPLLNTGITTIYLDTDQQQRPDIESATLDTAQLIKSLPAGALALLILGQSVPLIVKDEPEISLGRHVPGEPPPTVDLASHHGHLLGVSRRHAVIRRATDRWVIEDMNSNNGTWINDRRIPTSAAHPLQAGDQVRLGQLVLYVYFAG